ncbi:hypothetical protein ACWEVP_37175 [Amycolatopsis sp. NPDC003865]
MAQVNDAVVDDGLRGIPSGHHADRLEPVRQHDASRGSPAAPRSGWPLSKLNLVLDNLFDVSHVGVVALFRGLEDELVRESSPLHDRDRIGHVVGFDRQ